jgi:hypothetical protein
MKKEIILFIAICLFISSAVFAQVFKNEIKFDLSILNARLVNSKSHMDFYASTSIDGKTRQADLPIFVTTFYSNMSFQSAKAYLEFHKSRVLEENKYIKDQKISDTVIDGFKYYILTMSLVDKATKQEEQLVYGFVLKGAKAAFLLGSSTGDKKYVKKLQDSIYSLKV